MAQTGKPADEPAEKRPPAPSLDREPSQEPTPQDQSLPVAPEDAPKGQPNSDRFKTEQAHRPGKKDARKR
jgi:hypothetical protein